MKLAERATPVAAVVAAFSTLACCLPFGFLGALGLAGISVRLQNARPWLLVGAFALLVVGFVQLYRGRNQCRKRSTVSIVAKRKSDPCLEGHGSWLRPMRIS